MSDYDNTKSGVLYRNDRKERENQPDHRGSINVQCPCCQESSDFWLSAWVKTAGPTARNPGSKFFSLAVTPKEDQGDQTPTKPTKKRVLNDDGEFDDIPF